MQAIVLWFVLFYSASLASENSASELCNPAADASVPMACTAAVQDSDTTEFLQSQVKSHKQDTVATDAALDGKSKRTRPQTDASRLVASEVAESEVLLFNSNDEIRTQLMRVFLDDFAEALRQVSWKGPTLGIINGSLQHTFQDIFTRNKWGNQESRSGFGSTVAGTVGIRACLDSWMTKYNVRFLLDVPCGDGNWQGLIPGIADGAVKYQGYDISPGAVAAAKEKNRENLNMAFGELDLVNQIPTEHADMVMIKEVIQHLPLAMGLKMLQNAKAAGIKWLAVTSNPLYYNQNVAPGGWFPGPNAQAPPFNFGAEADRCGTLGKTGGENDFMLFDLHEWNGV